MSISEINEIRLKDSHETGYLSTYYRYQSTNDKQKEVSQLLHKLTVGADKLDIGLYLHSCVDEPLLKTIEKPRVPPEKYDLKRILSMTLRENFV